jgi:hypothetical protein
MSAEMQIFCLINVAHAPVAEKYDDFETSANYFRWAQPPYIRRVAEFRAFGEQFRCNFYRGLVDGACSLLLQVKKGFNFALQ